jgi:ribosomal protein L11 methyltransferase
LRRSWTPWETPSGNCGLIIAEIGNCIVNWIEISVQADGEATEAVTELFNRLNARPNGTGGAVTEVSGFDPVGEDHHPIVTVRTYLPGDDSDTPQRQRRIEEGLWFLGRIHTLGKPAVRTLAETDWASAWKTSYRPFRIGRRLLVIPAWLRGQVPLGPEDVPIVLDPGIAFGTGLHPSTQLCLLAMEDLLAPGKSVLDAGCGSGILSIGAGLLGAASVDAFDIDPVAVRASKENLALNDLATPVHVFASEGPGDGEPWVDPNGAPRTWDIILVNILPHIIASLLERGLHEHLASGGQMVLAGIIQAREPDMEATLAEHGLKVRERLVQEDWVALVVTK